MMKTLLISLCLIAVALSVASTNNEQRACTGEESGSHYDLSIGGDVCVLQDAFTRVPKLVSAVDINDGVTATSTANDVTITFAVTDPADCTGNCFSDTLYEVVLVNSKAPTTALT